MNKKDLAKEIVSLMGGPDNIKQSWHCITRLRFNFISKDKIDVDEIKKLNGVLGAQFQSGQFQIIIGNEVANVFAEISELLDGKISNDSTEQEKGNIIEQILDTISGIFTPLLPAITGGGLLKGVMALLVATNLMSANGSNYEVLSFIADAPFHFLPFLIAFSAAKRFKTNASLAITLAGVLMYPKIMEYAAGGEVSYLKFIGLKIPMNSYASSVLPIILAVLLLSYVHKYVSKLVPKSLTIVFTPLLTLLITAPLTLMFIGPLGNVIGVYLERFFSLLFEVAGPVAGMLMGGLMPLIVMTGMHYAFFPSTFASFDKVGYDIMLLPMNLVANLAQAGAVLGVFLKTKDQEMKQLSFSTLIPAFFGITEPAIYGVTMKLKKPFYASLAGGAVGGAIYGFFHVKTFAFSVPGITALPSYIEKGTNNFLMAVLGVTASFIISFTVTLFLKFDQETESVDNSQELVEVAESKSIMPSEVMSPISGNVFPLETVPDSTFAEGLLGRGVAVYPTEGTVKAPFDGEVIMLTPTNHAIGLRSNDGIEILIHIGLETVELNGLGFKLLVNEGQKIKSGDELITFDLEDLKAKNYNMITPIVITNASQYLDVVHTAETEVVSGKTKLLMLVN